MPAPSPVKVSYRMAVVFLGLTGLLRADVKLPSIFGDHMVLQQEASLPVWGTADAGEKVTVTVGTETASTTADAAGKWMIKLPPLPNGLPPVTMTVTGKNTLKFEDVLVGEVWLLGGQSNMEFHLIEADKGVEATAQANDPQLRLFNVAHRTALLPNSDPGGHWQLCTPDTAKNFSAVGYYFGRELRGTLHRPIGLISSNAGGTPAQAWSSPSSLKKDPALKNYADTYDTLFAAYPQALAEFPAKMAMYQAEKEKYVQGPGGDYYARVAQWDLDVAKAQAANLPPPRKPEPTFPLPQPPADPAGGWGAPTVLFNGMIAPVIPYAVRGVIWYQGEANVLAPLEYRALFPALIGGWREAWGRDDLPFIFAQLESVNGGASENWALMRESQAKALALPRTAMVVTADISDPKNVHSKDKLDAGIRFALAARHLVYGEDVVFSGPVYQASQVEGGAVRLGFTQTGSGLIIGAAPWTTKGGTPLPTDRLLGFAVAGQDQKWFAADAKIDGNTVVVSSPSVPQPVAVRYEWQNYGPGNLYNREGLPAPPFRSDDWTEPENKKPPLPIAAAVKP